MKYHIFELWRKKEKTRTVTRTTLACSCEIKVLKINNVFIYFFAVQIHDTVFHIFICIFTVNGYITDSQHPTTSSHAVGSIAHLVEHCTGRAQHGLIDAIQKRSLFSVGQ